MTRRRKLIDLCSNLLMMLASMLTAVILIAVLAFIVSKGKNTLSLDMVRGNYWSQNYLVTFTTQVDTTYVRPENLDDRVYFSSRTGIGVKNSIDNEKKKQIEVVYIDHDSPFNETVNASNGPHFGEKHVITVNDTIEKVGYRDQSGAFKIAGIISGDDAAHFVQKMDAAVNLENIYYRTPGGGIWGSLIATLLLIVLSLLFAMPVGIFAAIYLNEIAKPSRFNRFMENCIEMLAGVPSIIFGLMGVAVLFPITAVFNISGLSIVLGSMTMAIMLLPVIIRSIKEALYVVPDGLRTASLSLGATQTQTIFKVILPSALPGIMASVLLSVSRIIGESAALIYTMGTFINDAPTLTTGSTSLAVHIWSVMSHEQPNFELASAISMIILLMVFVLNITVKVITKRLEKKSNG